MATTPDSAPTDGGGFRHRAFLPGHPAMLGGNGLVKRLVGEVQPGGAGVQQRLVQGALFGLGFMAGFGDRAFPGSHGTSSALMTQSTHSTG